MEINKLWHKDFSLLVMGQITSLFGKEMMLFALPLYLLQLTGSASIFGIVLAVSLLPMIVFAPIGGIVADRVHKKRTIVVLDFLTSGVVLTFLLLHNNTSGTGLILGTMVVLSGIQGLFAPTIQAAIPTLHEGENLLKANAVVGQITAMAGLMGPILGGLLAGFFGIIPVLTLAGSVIFLSAVLECFMKIPHVKRPVTGTVLQLVKSELSEGLTFIRKEKPQLLKAGLVVGAFNLFVTSALIIGIPVFTLQTLELSNQMFGIAKGVFMAGSLAGGILVGMLGAKLAMEKIHLVLIAASLMFVPISAAFWIGLPPLVTFSILLASSFVFMALATLFSIRAITFIQSETPPHLIGKVMAFIILLSLVAQPLGNAMYGVVFEHLSRHLGVVLLVVAYVGVQVACGMYLVFRAVGEKRTKAVA